jgi:hypothetical protein
MMLLSLGLVAVLAVASFTLSFLGLIQAAGWAGIPEHLRWLVPIVVDSTILVYAVAASVQRARGESTTLSWVAVGFFTLVSVLANAAHVLAPGGVLAPLDATVVFGAFLAAIMPVSLFFATETTVKLAVAPVYQVSCPATSACGEETGPRGRKGPEWTSGPLRMDHEKDQQMDHVWTTQRPPCGPRTTLKASRSGPKTIGNWPKQRPQPAGDRVEARGLEDDGGACPVRG